MSKKQFPSFEHKIKQEEPFFDIALSFADEDRNYAEQIYELLTKREIKVFYDKHEEADLWGKDIYEYLSDIYTNKARFCVIIISSAYANKRWTSHELRNAYARAFKENKEYILPIRLDDTKIPGIRETIAYIDLRNSTVNNIVNAIIKKLSS